MAENIKHLSDENFKDEVAKGVTLVDFYADWCGPCRMIAPLLEELSHELKDQASIVKVDVENAQDTAGQYGITSVPTLVVFKDGQVVEQVVGVRDKAFIKAMVEKAL